MHTPSRTASLWSTSPHETPQRPSFSRSLSSGARGSQWGTGGVAAGGQDRTGMGAGGRDARLFPSRLLSNSSQQFEQLLTLLQLPAPLCYKVWQLVAHLPPNRKQLQELIAMKVCVGGEESGAEYSGLLSS